MDKTGTLFNETTGTLSPKRLVHFRAKQLVHFLRNSHFTIQKRRNFLYSGAEWVH